MTVHDHTFTEAVQPFRWDDDPDDYPSRLLADLLRDTDELARLPGSLIAPDIGLIREARERLQDAEAKAEAYRERAGMAQLFN